MPPVLHVVALGGHALDIYSSFGTSRHRRGLGKTAASRSGPISGAADAVFYIWHSPCTSSRLCGEMTDAVSRPVTGWVSQPGSVQPRPTPAAQRDPALPATSQPAGFYANHMAVTGRRPTKGFHRPDHGSFMDCPTAASSTIQWSPSAASAASAASTSSDEIMNGDCCMPLSTYLSIYYLFILSHLFVAAANAWRMGSVAC